MNAHTRLKAAAARITAANVRLVTVTPIVGPRHFAWRAESHEKLEQTRRQIVEQQFGARFADLQTDTECRAYLAVDRTVPSVEDVLAERFGNPGRFGSPPARVIDGDGTDYANRAWDAERAASVEQVAA